ncbi:Gamma Purothionin [Trema orientale]|uniref:Gamma Purothionin n=1 Tax=Trema orientale TaxID=63057 RepID=A0A2P5FLZ9_TREOI|nr:Gamma Purothionin [Trema orientale]
MTDENAYRSVQARTCEVPSGKYRGLCINRNNCVEVCQSEGYGYGKCSKIRRRCICLNPCN